MDAARTKRIAAAAAALLDERLGQSGFARAKPWNSGKSYHLQWERRTAWRLDRLELVRRYAVPSFYAQVHVEILLGDATAVSLHGVSVAYFLYGTEPRAWPSLLDEVAFLGSESRYAKWLTEECARALGFFAQAETPQKALAWARSPDRNGALPGTAGHARMLQRLETLGT